MTNNKQQTAVEWYSDKLLNILGESVNNFTKEQTLANHYALKEAKEMEKELTIRFALFYAYGQDNVSEQLRTKIEKWYDKIYEGGEQ
jgi:predicted solute-binding protein